MTDLEDAIRERLRMDEIVPKEMSSYTVADGRVSFHVPNLFRAALRLRGARPNDGWSFVGVEFDFTVVGDVTATSGCPSVAAVAELPRTPPAPLKQMIADEADRRLGLYVPKPVDPDIPADQLSPQPELAPGTVDAPLCRLYNYLQIMSLLYQLNILYDQAIRLRSLPSLGWADYLRVAMSQDRKTLTATYWVRKPPSGPHGQSYPVPLEGGKLIISVVRTEPREPLAATMALRGRTPSNTVKSFGLAVKWEPAANAWAVPTPPAPIALSVDAQALDFKTLLMRALRAHAQSIIHSQHFALSQFPPVPAPGAVATRENDDAPVLRFLCGEDAAVVATMDLRTGRLGMRAETDPDGRVSRLVSEWEMMINDSPALFFHAVAAVRAGTILKDAEQKASSLGMQHFRRGNFVTDDLLIFGRDVHGLLYIRLAQFQNSYLVVVIGDVAFRFAAIATETPTQGETSRMTIADLAWVDAERVRPGAVTATRFLLDKDLLKDLYEYCCARASYTKIEKQLQGRGIAYAYGRPGAAVRAAAREHAQFPHAVPVLCVGAAHIPAADAAVADIQIMPLHWWGDRPCEVVTSVKLKDVQPPVAPPSPAGTVEPPRMMRPSESILYDTQEAVVSYVSANVDTCVAEFLDQWAKVSHMVSIAREVTTMAKEREWTDVRLLAFDLRTVEFAYATGYAVTICCTDDLLSESIVAPPAGERAYGLRFRALASAGPASDENPHADMRELLERHLGAAGVRALVETLQDTLPVALELAALRRVEDARVDATCKGASWFQVLYADRHALDVRLRDDGAMLLDGAHPLAPGEAAEDARSLRPIPAFREMLLDTVQTLGGGGKGRVALLDAGLACERDAVREALRALHRRVSASLADSAS